MSLEGTPDWVGETIEVVKRPKCPNCGDNNVDSQWVKRVPQQTFKDTNFGEYAEVLKDTKTPHILEGDISFDDISFDFNQLSDFRQLVIRCKQCGYTETFSIP